MTNWNVPKIREECLKLMGHGIVDIGDSRKFSPHGDCGPSIYFKVVSPLGETRIVRYLDWAASNAPDPVYDLNDALPLMEQFDIILSPIVGEGGWCASDEFGEPPRPMVANDSAPLAVCLLALDKSGHNLDDFKLAGEA